MVLVVENNLSCVGCPMFELRAFLTTHLTKEGLSGGYLRVLNLLFEGGAAAGSARFRAMLRTMGSHHACPLTWGMDLGQCFAH